MDFLRLLVAQAGGLNNSLLWPFLIIIALAIIIWLLSWLLFPDPAPRPTHASLDGLTGLSKDLAAKLQKFGIYSDKDLVRLTPRGQQELESELGLHNGEYARWKQEILDRWRGAYLPEQLRNIEDIYPDPELGGLYSKKPEQSDNLTEMPGIDSLTANRMNAAGIYTFDQLRLLTPEQRANFKNRFGLSGFQFDSIPTTSSATAMHSTHRQDVPTSSAPSAHISNSAAMDAATSSLPAAQATTTQTPSSHSVSEAPKVADLAPVSAATATTTSTAQTVDSVIPKSKIDPDLGRVYSAPPPHRDDLSRLEGIDIQAAAKLNAAGVYTIDQLLSLAPAQQEAFKQRFNLPNADFGLWRRSGGPQGATSATPSHTTSASQHAAGLAGDSGPATTSSVVANELTVATPVPLDRLDIGYVYVTPPRDPDNLEQLDGVSPEMAKRLNMAGIYRFHQLSTMTAAQRENFKKRFDLPDLDFAKWLSTVSARQSEPGHSEPAGASPTTESNDRKGTPVGFAAGDASNFDANPASTSASSPTTTGVAHGASEQPPTADSKYGQVYTRRPQDIDDLSRLGGIDQAAESRLNGAGIYKYDQIRALSSQQLSNLTADLQLMSIDFADWRRCINAWSRGIETTAAQPQTYKTGWLHGVRLPEIAPGVFDGQQLVAYPEQTIFRGSNPEPWGKALTGEFADVTHSLATEDVRSDINYVRIRRVDTRDSVVAPITKGQLFGPGPEDRNGWNGLCESFFGGRHLGVYAREIPNEVETRFGIGGWGFGHRFDHNDSQEWGWAGRLLEPTTFEISVGRVGSSSGTVVFRSNDPTIWNQRTKEGKYRFAMPINAVSHPVNFLRLLRVDTGEAVIIRVDHGALLQRGGNPRLGWNGLCEEFSGGHHLGIYHRDAPQEVEICFGEGGWGFGHPFGDNNRQAFGWGGHAIGMPTVFEIALLEHVPDYLRHELME